MGVSVEAMGFRSPDLMTSLTRSSRARPIAPAGCREAKSSLRKPLASKTAMAKASPMTNIAVVLEVGARLKGQASRGMVTCSR